MKTRFWLILPVLACAGAAVWWWTHGQIPAEKPAMPAPLAALENPAATLETGFPTTGGEARAGWEAPLADSSGAGGGAGPLRRSVLDRLAYGQRWSGAMPVEMAAFRDWAEVYRASADAMERSSLESEGIRLARVRRPVLRELIEKNPRRAIDLAVPAAVRAVLPEAVRAELETRVSGTGDLAVVPREPAARPAPDEPAESMPGEDRLVWLAGRQWTAHLHGRRKALASKEGASLHGIALDGHLAVHESPLRLLEPGEIPAVPVEAVDPLSGAPVAAAGVADPGVFVEVHGRVWRLPDAAALVVLEQRLRQAEHHSNPRVLPLLASGGAADPAVMAMAATPWTTGTKRLLVVRVDFSDVPGPPKQGSTSTEISPQLVMAAQDQVAAFYTETSYGRTTLEATVADSVLRLPRTAASYATEYDLSGLVNDAKALMPPEHSFDSFDLVQLVFSYIGSQRIPGSRFDFAGVAFRGGKYSLINGYYEFDVVAHELGHNYGLAHANLWRTYGTDPVAGGSSEEYGDIYDMMGADASVDRRHHFNPWFKNRLGWLPDSAVTTITQSGTYRVHRFDAQDAPLDQPLGLELFREGSRWYWIGFRRNFTSTASLHNGAYVQWGAHSQVNSNLIACAPGRSISAPGLPTGAQLDDPSFGITIRTVGQGGSAPSEYLDIEVTRTQPPRNLVVHWGEDEAMPVPVGLSDVKVIAAGDEHGLVLKNDGALITWGDPDPEGPNGYGELSLPYISPSSIASISAGGDSSGVVKKDGTVLVWGVPDYGQNNIPAGLNNVKQLALGGDHALALRNDGTVVAWGSNERGQITVPAGLNGVQAVSAGRDMSLVLLENGTVLHWGINADQKPAGLAGVTAVAAGWGHGLALKSDGTVVAWGDNSSGQCHVPAGLSGVKQIGAGHQHSVALKNDGSVVAWGDDTFEQVSLPRGLPALESIAVAENHVLGLVPGTGEPLLQSPPPSTSVTSGFAALFNVSARSPTPMTYRWEWHAAAGTDWVALSDDGTYSGTATQQLRVNTAYVMNGDRFRCVVGNETSYTVTTAPAVLTVAPRSPRITRSPADRDVCCGETVTLGMDIDADPPVSFRWQRKAAGSEAWVDLIDGPSVAGAASATLSITAVDASVDNTQYRCVATDVVGVGATTLTAALRVYYPAPRVVGGGAPVLTAGSCVTLAATIPVGATCQWRHNGEIIAGATGTTLSLGPLGDENGGLYDVLVTDGTAPPRPSHTTRVSIAPVVYADRLVARAGFAPAFEIVRGPIVTLAVAPDDRIYVVGNLIPGLTGYAVLRLTRDGALDPTFSPLDVSGVNCLMPLPDGRVLIGGSFQTIAGVARRALARLNADGSVDTTFDAGLGGGTTVTTVLRQADGRLVIAGSLSFASGTETSYLARLSADGPRDTGFAAAGGPNNWVHAAVQQPDGRIVIAGSFDSFAGAAVPRITRLSADGARDPDFRTTVPSAGLAVVRLYLQPDGKIIASGGPASTSVRYLTSGERDGSYRPGISSPPVLAMAPAGDFMLVAISTKPWGAVERWRSDGTPDPSFTGGGTLTGMGIDGSPQHGAVQSDGSLLVVGSFDRVNHVQRGPIVRFTPQGAVDESFTCGARVPGTVFAILPFAEGWLVGGHFSHVDGQLCGGIARIRSDGSVDPTFTRGGGFNGTVKSLTRLGDGSIVVGGNFSHYAGQPNNLIARLDATGNRDASFLFAAAGSYSLQVDVVVADRANRLAVGGMINGHLVIASAAGVTLATPSANYWNYLTASSVLPLGDGSLLFGGSFSRYTFPTCGVARLGTDGSWAAGFGAGAPAQVLALAMDHEGRFLLGGSVGVRGVARLRADGSPDPAFVPALDPSVTIRAVLPQHDGRVVAAGSCSPQGQPLFRLRSDGSIDPTFEVLGLSVADKNAGVNAIALTATGSLLVGGDWKQYGAVAGRGLVLLDPADPAPTIDAHPAAQTVGAGDPVTFTCGITATPGTLWQWRRDGVAIPGATGATLTLSSVQAFHRGLYSLTATNAGGSVTSNGGQLTVSTPPASPSRLLNLSTRALCLQGEDVLIPGFVIGGSGTKRLLLRAVGPELQPFGVPAPLPDPTVVVKRRVGDNWVDQAANDDWGSNTNVAEIIAAANSVYAFDLAAGSKSSALVLDLPAGQYSAIASDTGDGGGIGMVELYDLDPASSTTRLINIANRGYVGTGNDLMIPGFVVSPEGPKTFLIRAVGPTLSNWGVSGVLSDPQLVIHRRDIAPGAPDVRILSNDNWGENGDAAEVAATAAQVYAFALPSGSKDAAFVVTLTPAIYTVQASGVNGATGVALVEVYVVN